MIAASLFCNLQHQVCVCVRVHIPKHACYTMCTLPTHSLLDKMTGKAQGGSSREGVAILYLAVYMLFDIYVYEFAIYVYIYIYIDGR